MIRKPASTKSTRAGRLWRCCAISLVGLLIAATLSACQDWNSSSPSCSSGTEAYNGKCLPHVTARYLACIDGKGFSVSNEMSVGATLPDVANSTFNVAYKRSKEEDSTVALQIVHDCLTLAEGTATSDTDRGAARQYARQATQYIDVVKEKLPAIELDPPRTLDCGPAGIGTQVSCQVTIKSTGLAPLQVSRTEVTGADSSDFSADAGCQSTPLEPGQSCKLTVQFKPSVTGERNATLVIHQNLPAPDDGTHLQLTGSGTASPPAGPTLTVTVDTSATPGGVTSNPSGIADCRNTCTGTFSDTDITLTVSYDKGTGQVTWGGCDIISGDNCTVHLTRDRTVAASLSPSP